MRRLLFVSPRFLFPADEGGKIRTGQILRGLKGGEFHITLVSPAAPAGSDFHDELTSVCDEHVTWPEVSRGRLFGLTRLRHIWNRLPIPVVTDRDLVAERVIKSELAKQPDVVVVDFVHAVVLTPDLMGVPSVLFTHNVETEIFAREAELASGILQRAIWRNQMGKMEALERSVTSRFDALVAVSDRDADVFRERFGAGNVASIPTGVDTDSHAYQAPAGNDTAVFAGALDWHANAEGIGWMLDEVWPLVRARRPSAKLCIVGRNPPSTLVALGSSMGVTFTGLVDAVDPYVHEASVYVIPLRVGGGTRIKAYEAMALGVPVVSTSVGIEGLSLDPDQHYLCADDAVSFAEAVCTLFEERDLRERISRAARDHVVENCSFRRAARAFEEICLSVVQSGSPPLGS